MIRLEGVTRRFGRRPGVEAVRDVSLRVAPGEICGIAGPNGAGKSTLLALTLGFLRPTRGEVRLFDLPPRELLRREGAGYVPERVALPARWRVGAALCFKASASRSHVYSSLRYPRISHIRDAPAMRWRLIWRGSSIMSDH